jgi:hypothetical protein
MGGWGERTNRRALVQAAGSGLALAGIGSSTAARSQTPTAGETKPVAPPPWYFAVHIVQDPYPGTMQAPQQPPAGTRYVAAEVEVINDADQALNFTPVEIRLRDESGLEYRGGGAIGAEPMINPRNLNPGERSRGWVWFALPVAAIPVELVYVAPAPQYRVPLPL